MANPVTAVEGGEGIYSASNHKDFSVVTAAGNRGHNAPPKCFRYLAVTPLLVLGIYGLVGMSLNIYDLLSEEPHGSWPFNSRPAKGTLVILQAFLILGFILGGIGTWRKNRNWYFWACLNLLGTAAILAIFGIVTLHASRTELEPKLLQALEKGGWDDFNWIDFIQHHHKCCGINSYSNWGRINGKLNPDDNGSGFDLDKDSLPASCCKRDVHPPPKEDCGKGALLVQDNWKEFTDRIYVKHCGPVIIRPARAALINLGIEMVVVAFLTLSISLFLFCGASELFCLAPDRARRRDGDPAENYNSNTEDEDEDDEEEKDDNENLTEEELRQSRKERNKWQNNEDGTVDSSKNRQRSKQPPRNIHAGEAMKPKSKQKSGSGKDKQYLSKSSAKGVGVGQVRGQYLSNPKKPGNGGTFGSNPRSKKSRQNDTMSNNKNKNKSLAKGNFLNNNVPFGHHAHNSNRSPSRTGGTRSDMAIQKLETLYVGVDLGGHGMSTLSTTPNPSGAIFFPWTNKDSSSSSPPPPASTGEASNSSTTTTKSGGKTKGPQISHYSSVPHFPQQPLQPHHTHHKGRIEILPSFYNPHSIPISGPTPTVQRLKEPENLTQSAQRHIQGGVGVELMPSVTTYSEQDKHDVKVDVEFDHHNPNSDRFENVVVDALLGQGQCQGVEVVPAEPAMPRKEFDIEPKKSSQITLNIPGEVLPPPVEATNAINLMNEIEDAQKTDSFRDPSLPSSPANGVVSEDICRSNSSESTNTSTASVISANMQMISESCSLGFENSSSSSSCCGAGTGESSESEDEDGAVSDGDVQNPRKNQRLPTLPTIVEEPEPNTPKKESPIGSDSELKKNEPIQIQIGEEQAVGYVEEQMSSSIANANVNVNVFGGGA